MSGPHAMAGKLLARMTLALALSASATPIRAEETETAVGTRRALIVCGLTGDATHRALFSQTIETIYAGLTTHHGFSTENVTVLWSEPKENNDGSALLASTGPATREALSETAAKIVES